MEGETMSDAAELDARLATLAVMILLPVLILLVFRLGAAYGLALAAEADHTRRVIRRFMRDNVIVRDDATPPDC